MAHSGNPASPDCSLISSLRFHDYFTELFSAFALHIRYLHPIQYPSSSSQQSRSTAASLPSPYLEFSYQCRAHSSSYETHIFVAMRLLDTRSLDFREFFDSDIPRYAILSHRWGSDEASFQDFERGVQQSRKGFSKIKKFCDLALQSAIEWAWVDTCCIDKKSSAELTEAINSMYNWYGNAVVCCVYLSDVGWEESTPKLRQTSLDRFRKSEWFTRGWTLQELLAPSIVVFFDRDWRYIGTKDEFASEISQVTEIDTHWLSPGSGPSTPGSSCIEAPDCLVHLPTKWVGSTKCWEPSVATRMSWASKRQTSRIEDMAYCLLGIFGINMPLLYGEGQKAFMRLQYEIISQIDDDSIFAWTRDLPITFGVQPAMLGVLAKWPDDFTNSRYVQNVKRKTTFWRPPYSITNQGLVFPITWRGLVSRTESNDKPLGSAFRIPLNCGICGPKGFQKVFFDLIESWDGSWYRLVDWDISVISDGALYYNPRGHSDHKLAQIRGTFLVDFQKSDLEYLEDRALPEYRLNDVTEVMLHMDSSGVLPRRWEARQKTK